MNRDQFREEQETVGNVKLASSHDYNQGAIIKIYQV